MKRVAKKLIIVLFVITLLFSILGTISKIFIRKNLNIATLDESNNLAIYPDNIYYSCNDIGSGVEKIHFYGDTTNYGWCMDKGANLYGYGYSGGYGHVSGVSNAYTTNNARSGYSGSIQWLIDNMLRVGDNVSEDEKGWYRNNLQRILGSSAQISSYSDDEIFKMQQFALWHFTDNVTGDSGISYPTSDPLYNALYNAANAHANYTTKTNKVSVSTTGAAINSNGVVGPFAVSNNNVMNLTAKLNGTDTKIYTNAECTQELSKYNDYNGNVYIKVTDQNNVNIVFNWGAFNTTANYYTTEGNPGNYRDQSFLMIEREKYTDSVSFEQSLTGSYHMNIAKKSKKDPTGNPIVNAGFRISQKINNTGTEYFFYQAKAPNTDKIKGKGTYDGNIFYTNNANTYDNVTEQVNIDDINSIDLYTIKEVEAPPGFQATHGGTNGWTFGLQVVKGKIGTKLGITSIKIQGGSSILATVDSSNRIVMLDDNLKATNDENNCAVKLELAEKSDAFTFTWYDEPIEEEGEYNVELIKKSTNGTQLGGVKFTAKAVINGAEETDINTKQNPLTTSATEAVAIRSTVTIDKDKVGTPDTYTLREYDIGNNEGHLIGIDKDIVLTVKKESKTSGSKITNSVVGIELSIEGETATNSGTSSSVTLSNGAKVVATLSGNKITIIVDNPEVTGAFNLDLIKYVQGTTIPLPGAEFKVSVKDGTKELADVNKTYITGNDGHFTEKVSGIGIEAENKTYTVTVTETKVPIGYEGISGPITFNVTSKLSSDGKSYVLTAGTPTTATNAKKVTVTEGQVVIEAENKPEGPHKGVKEVYNQDSGYDKDEVQDWVITSRIPSGIDKYSRYIITDPIDERLVFSGIENVKVALLDGETLEEKETLTADEDYKVNYDGETRTLKVSFIEDDFKAGQELEVGSIVEIRFNTTFALDEEGNIIALNQSVPNQAVLEYDNNNKLYTEIPEVHTGGVGLYKYDVKTGKAIEGAKFKIARTKEDAENGEFVKDSKGNDIEVITNEKGIAVFEGLEFGEDAMDDAKYQTGENIYGQPVYAYNWEEVQTTYYIVETESPAGYSKIEEVIEAVVKKDNYDINDIETLIKVGNESNIYDLALRKFITAVKDGNTGEEEKVTTRIPDVDIANLVDGTSTTATYTHPKDPVLVHTTDTVTYTIRIFNEGPQDAYASLIKDDIPDGLEFVQYTEGDGSVNDTYRWRLVDENDNEVTDIAEAKYIITDYLSKESGEKVMAEQNLEENPYLLEGFNPDTMDELDYRDVQVQFKVVEPTTSDRILINYAQISEETDRNGNKVTDRDSTPNEWKNEDDEDIEKVRVLYFDLALRKWVTQAIVTENGQTVVTETGHKAEDDPEEVVKVDLKKSKLNNVTVKFRYSIRITNEGEIAGEATEIRDDIPNGLKFIAEDNPDWREENGEIVTNKLANTTLQPGESAEVEIVLTWVNSEDNMGVMVNTAEINKDHNVYGTPDIDSTPGNNVPGEDDIDDAPVMLTIKTGSEIIMYTTLGLGVVAIIGAGVVAIKKRVLIK